MWIIPVERGNPTRHRSYVSGAAAGLQLVMSPDSHIPLIGASGAISGLLGFYAAFFPKAPTDLSIVLLRWEVKTFQFTALGAVGVWFGEQLLLGWVTSVSGLDKFVGIAFWAHVGGLLVGAAVPFSSSDARRPAELVIDQPVTGNEPGRVGAPASRVRFAAFGALDSGLWWHVVLATPVGENPCGIRVSR